MRRSLATWLLVFGVGVCGCGDSKTAEDQRSKSEDTDRPGEEDPVLPGYLTDPSLVKVEVEDERITLSAPAKSVAGDGAVEDQVITVWVMNEENLNAYKADSQAFATDPLIIGTVTVAADGSIDGFVAGSYPDAIIILSTKAAPAAAESEQDSTAVVPLVADAGTVSFDEFLQDESLHVYQ